MYQMTMGIDLGAEYSEGVEQPTIYRLVGRTVWNFDGMHQVTTIYIALGIANGLVKLHYFVIVIVFMH